MADSMHVDPFTKEELVHHLRRAMRRITDRADRKPFLLEIIRFLGHRDRFRIDPFLADGIIDQAFVGRLSEMDPDIAIMTVSSELVREDRQMVEGFDPMSVDTGNTAETSAAVRRDEMSDLSTDTNSNAGSSTMECSSTSGS